MSELVWQDFVEPDYDEDSYNYSGVESSAPELDLSLLDNSKVNELIRADIKKNLINDIDNNPEIARTIIGCALNYLMAGVSTTEQNPWSVANDTAHYLNDFFDYPIDEDGEQIWEAAHPGYKFPRD